MAQTEGSGGAKREWLTKAAARNIFYGGTVVFIAVFIGLSIHSRIEVRDSATDESTITDSVKLGKATWERNSCINCHTILGEGAYFAPELGNVWARYGGFEDPEGAREALKIWMTSQPTGIEGRRQMPNFNLNDDELEGLVDFFEWVNGINTQGWPPNEAG